MSRNFNSRNKPAVAYLSSREQKKIKLLFCTVLKTKTYILNFSGRDFRYYFLCV